MEDLIILGTGVHAGEMAYMVERINQAKPTWNLLGHISKKPQSEDFFAGNPILGDIAELKHYPSARLVCDNVFPKDIALPGERFISLVDPSCYVHPSAQMGPGCVIYPNCFVGLNAILGWRVFVLSGSIINHDDHLEDNVIVCSNVSLAGYVHVEKDVYLGQACTVRQSLRIGQKSLIGMGSVVVKDVPQNCVMVGNPARKLRDK
ncbi:MAG: DapH/DapD/GlmU-related protein [Planctomycetota bacterium]|nr:DapH/DapD/GlmU-related protein [Planctomycetota bacterium]